MAEANKEVKKKLTWKNVLQNVGSKVSSKGKKVAKTFRRTKVDKNPAKPSKEKKPTTSFQVTTSTPQQQLRTGKAMKGSSASTEGTQEPSISPYHGSASPRTKDVLSDKKKEDQEALRKAKEDFLNANKPRHRAVTTTNVVLLTEKERKRIEKEKALKKAKQAALNKSRSKHNIIAGKAGDIIFPYKRNTAKGGNALLKLPKQAQLRTTEGQNAQTPIRMIMPRPLAESKKRLLQQQKINEQTNRPPANKSTFPSPKEKPMALVKTDSNITGGTKSGWPMNEMPNSEPDSDSEFDSEDEESSEGEEGALYQMEKKIQQIPVQPENTRWDSSAPLETLLSRQDFTDTMLEPSTGATKRPGNLQYTSRSKVAFFQFTSVQEYSAKTNKMLKEMKERLATS